MLIISVLSLRLLLKVELYTRCYLGKGVLVIRTSNKSWRSIVDSLKCGRPLETSIALCSKLAIGVLALEASIRFLGGCSGGVGTVFKVVEA